jgi:glycosyltransferase involved in cell wall biosynthesis
MHIAIDARIINSSTGRYVERLLTHLQDIDTVNDYTVLVRQKDLTYWHPTGKNFTVKVADFDNYSFAEQFSFNSFLKQLSPDLVHFCMPQQPVLYRGKKVTTFHDLTLVRTYNSDKNWLVFHAKQLIGKAVFKLVAKTSDHIITPSDYTKEDLMQFVALPATKVSVTYEAADPASGQTTPVALPFTTYLLYVGQQSDYKNIKRLGEAHQQLVARFPDLGLVLAGKKNKASLTNEAYFTEKGYRNIIFTDFVPDAQLNWLYDNASAYVFPSLMEGFGLPGLEAMVRGVPVISSNATCLPEIYGDAARYFDPTDTDNMAKVIGEVLTDNLLRTELVQKGRDQAARYSWKKMALQTHAIYEQVLKN